MGVVECTFLRYYHPYTVVGTNKGLFVLTDTTMFLVNEPLGLPDRLELRDVELRDDQLLLATDDGLYTIDLNALNAYRPTYDISLVQLNLNGKAQRMKLGEVFTLPDVHGVLSVEWEVNQHPYPANLSYEYALGNQEDWQPVLQPGFLRIDRIGYGAIPLRVRMVDATNSQAMEVCLLTLVHHRPFYQTVWFGVLLSAVLMGLSLLIVFKQRMHRLKKQREKALEETVATRQQLDTLRFLLKPHFLFNALTSIQNLIIEQDFNRSLTYISYFAKFLRGILDDGGDHLIPLAEEVKHIDHFVNLERLRFNENVNLSITIDPIINPNTQLIVPFLFQPLFENSFKHAFTPSCVRPTISFTVQRRAASTVYTISDNGKGLGGLTVEDLCAKSTSKGLKIVLSQLNRFYKGRYTIAIDPQTPSGTSFIIELKD